MKIFILIINDFQVLVLIREEDGQVVEVSSLIQNFCGIKPPNTLWSNCIWSTMQMGTFYQRGQTKMRKKRLLLRLNILMVLNSRASSQPSTAINLCSVKENTARKPKTTIHITNVIQESFVMVIHKEKTVAWKSNSLSGRDITHWWASSVLHKKLWVEVGAYARGNAQMWLWPLNLIFTKGQWFIRENLKMETLKAIAMW